MPAGLAVQVDLDWPNRETPTVAFRPSDGDGGLKNRRPVYTHPPKLIYGNAPSLPTVRLWPRRGSGRAPSVASTLRSRTVLGLRISR